LPLKGGPVQQRVGRSSGRWTVIEQGAELLKPLAREILKGAAFKDLQKMSLQSFGGGGL
jgi:hypothetical protein